MIVDSTAAGSSGGGVGTADAWAGASTWAFAKMASIRCSMDWASVRWAWIVNAICSPGAAATRALGVAQLKDGAHGGNGILARLGDEEGQRLRGGAAGELG
jgi:hypothetical protein